MKRLRVPGFPLVLCLLLSFMAPGFCGESYYGEPSNAKHKHHTEQKHHSEPKHHTKNSRVGFHGMVLVTDGTELYASHLPLYVKPHDYQLIYLLESAHKNRLIDRLTGNEKYESEKVRSEAAMPHYQQNMVTLLPAKFDLNQLINGESFEITTQFFTGHFERGGEKWFKENKLKFVRQVFKRPLANLVKATSAEGWNALKTAQTETQLFIFPIQSSPSFDAIVLGTGCSDKPASISNSFKQAPDFMELKKAFSGCNSNKVLYFETQDFAQ